MNLQVFLYISICTRSPGVSAFPYLWARRAGHSLCFISELCAIHLVLSQNRAVLFSSMEHGSKECLLWIWSVLHVPRVGSCGGVRLTCAGAPHGTGHYCNAISAPAAWAQLLYVVSSTFKARLKGNASRAKFTVAMVSLTAVCLSDERESSRSLRWLKREHQAPFSSFQAKNNLISDPAQVTGTADMWACA